MYLHIVIRSGFSQGQTGTYLLASITVLASIIVIPYVKSQWSYPSVDRRQPPMRRIALSWFINLPGFAMPSTQDARTSPAQIEVPLGMAVLYQKP
jgi:hypothetical protein